MVAGRMSGFPRPRSDQRDHGTTASEAAPSFVLGEVARKEKSRMTRNRTPEPSSYLLPVLTGVAPVLALHNEHPRDMRSTHC